MNKPIDQELATIHQKILHADQEIKKAREQLFQLEERLARRAAIESKVDSALEEPVAAESPPVLKPVPQLEPPPLPPRKVPTAVEPVVTSLSDEEPEVIPGESLPAYIKVEPVAVQAEPVEPKVPLSQRLSEKWEGLREQIPAFNKADLETRIGEVWFNRIGIVAIVVAMALLARLISPQLQAWHKVALAFLTGFGIFGGGAWLARKFLAFGRSLMAAGMAIVFLAAYGMHFVPAMSLTGFLPSVIGMLLAAGWLLACAESWKSQGYAGFALFLGYAAAFVAGGDTAGFSLTTLVILSATSLALVIRNNWYPLSVFSLAAAYLSHYLWGVNDGLYDSPIQQFLHNFPYLTAYYGVFLASGSVFARRMANGVLEVDLRHRQSGRLLGPVNLILYSAFALGLFHVTGLYWSSVYLFLLPLALVQVVVAIHQHVCREEDYVFYLAAAVTFFTMGLFSLADGLSLNLALAVEALLLLLASRRQRLWILNPLAQVVLAINFTHFWFSDARLMASWPVFAGSLVTSAVYLVKARMEETWSTRPMLEPEGGFAWLSALRLLMDKITPHLAPVHAALAGVLLVWQCTQFFNGPWESVWIGSAVLLLAAAALRWRGKVFSFAAAFIALLNVGTLLVALNGMTDLSAARPGVVWIGYQLAALFPVIGAVLLAAYRPNDTLWGRKPQAYLLMMAALPAVCVAPMLGHVSTWCLPIALLPTLAYGWVAYRSDDQAWPLALGSGLSAVLALWFTISDPLLLTIALAGTALIMTALAARVQRLWAMRPVSQAILALSFFHFWFSTAHELTSSLRFVGAVLIPVLYVVQALVAENWNRFQGVLKLGENKWVAGQRALLSDLTPRFAPVLTTLASILFAGQFLDFFSAAEAAIGMGLVTAGFVLLSVVVNSPALVFGGVVLTLINGLAAWSGGFDASGNWFAYQAAVCLTLLSGAVLVWRKPFASLWQVFPQGFFVLASALPLVWASACIGSANIWLLPIALVAPAIFAWAATQAGPFGWRIVLALIAGLTGVLIIHQWAVDPAIMRWILPAVMLPLLAYTNRRSSVMLLPGLVLYAVLSSGVLIMQAERISFEPAALFHVAVLAFAALTTMYEGRSRQKIGFVWASLALIVLGAGFMWVLTLLDAFVLHQFLLWIAISLGFYASLQTWLTVKTDPEAGEWPGWSTEHVKAYAAGLSLFVSGSLACVLYQVFPQVLPEIRIFTALALGAFVLAYVKRSVVFAAAYGCFLLAAHLTFFGLTAPYTIAVAAPFSTACLALLTLLAGLGSECILRGRLAAGRQAFSTWLKGGAAVANFLGLMSGCLVVYAWGQHFFGETSLAFALQIAVPVLAVCLARIIRAEGHLTFALGASAWLAMELLLETAGGSLSRTFLVQAGIVFALGLLVIDRLAASLRSAEGGGWMPQAIRGSAWALPPMVGLTLLLSQAGSPALQGGWTTLSWSFSGLALVAFGFVAQSRIYRHVALGIFALAIIRIVLIDIAGLETFYRMMAFLALGVCLVLVSFLYAAFKRRVST